VYPTPHARSARRVSIQLTFLKQKHGEAASLCKHEQRQAQLGKPMYAIMAGSTARSYALAATSGFDFN